MKLIIAGSRYINLQPFELKEYLKKFNLEPTCIISGGCRGVDRSAEYFAKNLNIPFINFPAEWVKFGLSAGPRRNMTMAKSGDVLLLIWNGKSFGSRNMKKCMLKLNKPIFEVIRDENDNL